MNKYLVISTVDDEIKNDVVKADSVYEALNKINFIGHYDCSEHEVENLGVYELGNNLLIDIVEENPEN